MSPQVTTISEEDFASTSTIRNYVVDIDPGGEDAPDTIESLLAAYGACYMPALRVSAKQRDLGELGRIENVVDGPVDENGKLVSIAFDITVDAELSADDVSALIERADELCKVHAAIRPRLQADITVNGLEPS